jgi:8-oxo-dGTP diphosphatase
MKYRNPALTVDGVLIEDGKILLIKRGREPFKGKWALPGGFVEYGERVEDAVIREFREETGIEAEIISLLGVYSDPNRDPRGHTVSIVYLLKRKGGELKGGDDASEARFFSLDNLPELAFDHDKIIRDAVEKNR